jgi:hypothetical protein
MLACSSNSLRLSFSAVRNACSSERSGGPAGFESASTASGIADFGTIFSAPAPTISCSSAIICFIFSIDPEQSSYAIEELPAPITVVAP